MISQIGITYRDSSLSAHDGDSEFEVKAGDRLPYFLVGGKSVYDNLRAPKFHLLTFSGDHSDYAGDYRKATDEIDARHVDLFDQFVMPLYPQAGEIFGTDQPFHVLLRPDNYIAFISSETSPRRLVAYLNEIIANGNRRQA